MPGWRATSPSPERPCSQSLYGQTWGSVPVVFRDYLIRRFHPGGLETIGLSSFAAHQSSFFWKRQVAMLMKTTASSVRGTA